MCFIICITYPFGRCIGMLVVKIWPMSGSRHVSLAIRISWRHSQGEPLSKSSAKNIPGTILFSRGNSRGCSSSRSQFSRLEQQTPTNHTYICGVLYATRSLHISNMIYDPYFNVTCYRKQQISLPQSRAQFKPLRKIVMCRSCDFWISHDSHRQQKPPNI